MKRGEESGRTGSVYARRGIGPPQSNVGLRLARHSLLIVAIAGLTLIMLGCGGGRSGPVGSAGASSATHHKTYTDARLGFSVTYDASKLTMITKLIGVGRLGIRFIADGETYHGLVGEVGLADRDSTDTYGKFGFGGLVISAMRATRPVDLPSLAVFQHAPQLLFVVSAGLNYHVIGDQGVRTVAPVVLAGLSGFKITSSGGDVRLVCYVLVKGHRMYTLAYAAATHSWPAIEPVFEDAVASFKITL